MVAETRKILAVATQEKEEEEKEKEQGEKILGGEG